MTRLALNIMQRYTTKRKNISTSISDYFKHLKIQIFLQIYHLDVITHFLRLT